MLLILHKESDMTEWLNFQTFINFTDISIFIWLCIWVSQQLESRKEEELVMNYQNLQQVLLYLRPPSF